MKKLRSDNIPLLACTAGDFYGTADVFSEAKSHFVARMMKELGYDAIGVGEMDLNFGLGALVKDARAYQLPIVCANLTARVDSVRIRGAGAESKAADRLGTAFSPYHIVTRAGARFGFVGLLSPATKTRAATAASVEALTYTIGDAIEAAKVIVPDVRPLCDVLVVLAHMDENEARRLATEVPGIDIVVLGHDPAGRPLGEQIVVGTTHIVRATAQGQYVGQLDIKLAGDHHLADARNQLHSLSAAYPDDPDMNKLLDAFDQENRKIQKDLYAREQLKGAGDNSFGTRYVGLGTCQSCHEDAFNVYMTTRHAHAYETLSSEFVNRDTNCVGCHVTGYGEEGGFGGMRMRGAMVDLVDVQCEACHGPGAEHTRDGSYAARAKEACVRCHTPNDDPNFDYDTYWPRIAH
jgi:mono/diheme cytochrome c family protein